MLAEVGGWGGWQGAVQGKPGCRRATGRCPDTLWAGRGHRGAPRVKKEHGSADDGAQQGPTLSGAQTSSNE